VASIERTAYPRFKRYYTANELDKIYTPTRIEIAFALKVTAGEENHFNLLVLLKVFQRLGYFPKITDIPLAIINHIRTVLDLQEDRTFSYQYPSTLSRHKKAIRSYLQVSPFNQKGKAIITAVITESALRMDNPADLINVAIEEVVKERYEQVQTRDYLVEMFLKQMKKIHNLAIEELDSIKKRQQITTEKLVSVLTDVLVVFNVDTTDSKPPDSNSNPLERAFLTTLGLLLCCRKGISLPFL
jgi:hypothetical protein